MNKFYLYINIKFWFQNKVEGKFKLYVSIKVYVQYTCNLLFLCRSLQHNK